MIVEREQRGPVAALAAVCLTMFLQLSMSAWYFGEVVAGPRKLCASGCPDAPPSWLVIGRFVIWAGLLGALIVAARFGRDWVMGDRGPRRLAIAAGVAALLIVVLVVLAVVYPPWYRPKS
ncbi:MAG: hypothetical protein QOJ07_1488 [Thermoleophilaceae bacterium]|jgi:hypothetical protein|nr:hypothetical protein [Thermoleophilaceae bacterium]